MIVYLILSLVAVIIGVAATFRKTQKFENYSLKLTLTVSVATAILVYPYFRQDFNQLISFLSSIRYGVGIIAIDIDEEVIENMTSAGSCLGLYKILLYVYYALAPLLGSATILSFSKNFIDGLRMKMSNTIHIFSSLNDKSVNIAEYVRKKDASAKIVFFKWEGVDEKIGLKAKELDAIFPKYPFSKFIFNNKKNYIYYQIDKDTSENLNNFTKNYQRFEKLSDRQKSRLEFKCFTDSDSVEMIRKIDKYISKSRTAVKGSDIKVSFINEENMQSYKLFHDLIGLIDTDTYKKEILVIGTGEDGISILKTALWLFDKQQMQLTIDVIDKNAYSIASRLKLSCPDILNAPLESYYNGVQNNNNDVKKNYDIRFYEVDADSYALADTLLGDRINPDIIFITMGDDVLCQKTGERIRRILAKKNDSLSCCPIVIRIRNDKTYEMLSSINQNNNIVYFGNNSDKYKNIFEINNILEAMARKVHLAYMNSDDEDIDKVLNESGYYYLSNHESSLAQALSIEYKVKHILNRINDQGLSAKEAVKAYLDDSMNVKNLCAMEHDRWNCYERCEGWTTPTLVQERMIAKLAGNGKTINNPDLLLHPAIVDNDELLNAEKTADAILKEIKDDFTPTDYINKDAYIIKRIPTIISEELISYIKKNNE